MSKSLKELFAQKANQKITGVSSSLKQLGDKIESADYLKVNKIFRNRVLPHVDFSKPDKWVRFGSAEKYYEDAVKNIYESYPYDGSEKEKIQWHNSSSYFENYVFDNEYPRTNGHVGFPGSSFSSAGTGSYGTPSSEEYIIVTGSINKNNIYDASKNRTDNLIFDLSKDGATVEFWLKKDAWLGAAKTKREVIFDLWNQQPKASAAYGRLRIEMDSTSADTVFLISAVSGTSGVKLAPIGTSGSHGAAFTTTKVADSKWHHYAFTFKNVSSNIQAEMYCDGQFVETLLTGSNINGVSGSIPWTSYVNKPVVATIGALAYRTSFNADSIAKIGHGKLSASIDEFRYWKSRRTAKQIGSNYFGQVGGGSNSDEANTSLGLYYKFNEGMSGISTLDDTILDYSGRVANGKYVGFVSGTYQRSTGSAMVISGKAKSEFKDPIIYKAHPKVTNYYNTKTTSGSAYDHQNPSSIYNTFPSWVSEEDNYGTLYNLSQIIASYFDNLYLQIRELPKLKNIHYPSGSEKPYPFANYLLQDKGMFLGEIFNDSTLLEDYKDQSEDFNFKEKLTNIKNRIYQNIYNNLEYIYKSKGTEKSIRAMLRSMGLADDLVKINYYGNNLEFEFKDNYRSATVKKRILNITTGSTTASVFQDSQKFDDSDTNQNDGALSYLKGGEILKFIPYTMEANVFFAKKFKQGTKFFSDINLTSSLFGMHTIDVAGMGAHTTTWDKSGFAGTPTWIDYANTRVFVTRPTGSHLKDSGYARFHLVAGHNSIVNMSSSWFANVYDDRHWNVNVRLKPKNDSVHFSVANMNVYKSHEYEMEFHGATTKLGEVDQEFHLTKTLTYDQATAFLTSSKKIYAGAHKTNFTGTLISPTDNNMTSFRYWFSYLNKEELRSHVKDIKNYGVNHPYKNAILHLTGVSLLDTKGFLNTLSGTYIPKIKTLGIHWNFENVTGSDPAGQFIVKDFSSGSALPKTWEMAAPTGNYGPFGEYIDRYYPGLGHSFAPNDSAAVIEDYIYTAKQQLPEVLSSADQIEIRNFDDDIFTRSSRPMSYFAAIEKSPYQIVSDEMLDIFATMVDFNDIIGAPVNKYRQEYKELNKLRELFFQRVKRSTDFDRFLEFYKWVDFTIHRMLQDLIPVSANVSSDIKTILESHILERNKYQHRYPGFKNIKNDPEGVVEIVNKYAKSGFLDADVRRHTAIQKWAGVSDNVDYVSILNGGLGGYKSIEHNVDATTKKLDVNRGVFKSIYREIDDSHAGTSTAVDTAREKIRKSILKNVSKQTFEPIVRAGVDVAIRNQNNQHLNKRINYIKQTFPFKNEATDDHMLIEATHIVSTASISTPENPRRQISPGKQRLAFKASIMRYDKVGGGLGIEDDSLKGDYVAPFTLYTYASTGSISGSPVDTLFQSGHEFTNLHTDLIDQTGEVSLQGPFTERHVGGMAHRHTDLNTNVSGAILDTEDTRAEAWRIRFSSNTAKIYGPGADENAAKAVHKPRVTFFRQERAKRPVNIRNIKTTSSVKNGLSVEGNYYKNYEVVQTAGGDVNNLWFVHNSGSTAATGTIGSIAVSGAVDFEIEDRTYLADGKTRQKTVIYERFSAPGGPEVNSFGYLDVASRQYSVYNSLNYRNSLVRDILNRSLLKNHEGKYSGSAESTRFAGSPGFDAILGANAVMASYHDTHNNRAWRLQKYEKTKNYKPGTERVTTGTIFNNAFVSTPIPASDRQYLWITKSLNSHSPHNIVSASVSDLAAGNTSPALVQDVLGYAPYDGILSSSTKGYYSAIEFVSASVHVAYSSSKDDGWNFGIPKSVIYNNNESNYGISSGRLAVLGGPGRNILFTDFTNLNHMVYEPVSSSTHVLGYPSMDIQNVDTGSAVKGHINYFNKVFLSGAQRQLHIEGLHGRSGYGEETFTGKFEKSRNNPGEVAVLNAVLLNRNGPYGYPSWKQTRTAQHPVARHLRKNNIIDVQRNPKSYTDEYRNEYKERFNPNFDSYTVPVVAENRRRPLKFTFLTKPDKLKDVDAVEAGAQADQTNPVKTPLFGELITLETTYGNNYIYFPQEKLNKQAGVKVDEKSTAYDDLTGMYLYGGLGDQSEISRFVSLEMTEKIFPREENEFLSRTYIRSNFLVEYWNRDPSLRRGTGSFRPKAFGKFTWGFDQIFSDYAQHTGSIWPLDGPKDFTSASSPDWTIGYSGINPTSNPWMIGAGELQSIHNASFGPMGSGANRNFIGPVYLRPAYEITVDDSYGDSPPGSGNRRILVAGMPNWDTPAGSGIKSGRQKEPFPEGTYEQWTERIRRQGQGFSLVPEFRISEHIDTYLSEVGNFRFLGDNEGFLTITGSAASSSADCAFAKEYLHTDFIKQFHIIDEHKETPFVNGNKVQRAEASSLTLKCQALMKFLPYEGFHPAVRTIQLASLFSASYFPSSTGSAVHRDGVQQQAFIPTRLSQYRPIFQPYFSPGILYNSIKSGLAVDYPVFTTDHKFNNTASLGVVRYTGSFLNSTQDYYKGPNNSGEAKNKQYGEWILGRPRVKDNFDMRLPFESLLDPAEAILGKRLTTGEPEASSSLVSFLNYGHITSSIVKPPVDPRYKMAMHNFVAESQKLFCEKQVIKSDISDLHPDFGNMSGSSPYSMYVILKKGSKNMIPYSRHSAFGYPVASGFTTTNAATTNALIPIPGAELGGTSPLPKLEALSASYAAFTPPYEDIDLKSGEPIYSGSLVRITFNPKHHDPTLDNSRFDLQTILSGAQVIYARNGFIPHGAHNAVSAQAGTSSLDNAMQISASLNLFSVVEEYSQTANLTDAGLIAGAPDLDPDKAGRKWVIEPKWQVPIYDYRGYKEFAEGQAQSGVSGQEVAGNGLVVTIPTFGTGTMTFGQWHQYGIPPRVEETVGIEIVDVPGANSLAKAVGLRQGWYPLSRIAERRQIKEAVVAIPFRLIRGKKMFFKIERDRINKALFTELIGDPERKEKAITSVGKDIVDMVEKMQRYVIPPQFDFMTFDGKKDKEEVTPLAMYIFEFTHDLKDTDLSDMWQNLVPDLAYDVPDVQESVVKVTHPLLTEAIKKAQISASPIGNAPNKDDIKKKLGFIELHKDLRWMVFKVKQKAAWNYYRELKNDRGDIALQLEENTRRFNGRTRAEQENAKQFKTKEVVPLYSYNWPYDFFTMIELVKMDATIKLTPQNVEETKPNPLIGGPGAGSAEPVPEPAPAAAPIEAPQAARPEEVANPSPPPAARNDRGGGRGRGR